MVRVHVCMCACVCVLRRDLCVKNVYFCDIVVFMYILHMSRRSMKDSRFKIFIVPKGIFLLQLTAHKKKEVKELVINKI